MCIAYVAHDFELDVFGISVAWAGFGFLFLVHDKVIAQRLKSKKIDDAKSVVDFNRHKPLNAIIMDGRKRNTLVLVLT